MSIARLFVDAPPRTDERARINTRKLGQMADLTALQLRIEATGDNIITIFRGSAVALDSGAFFLFETDMIIGAAQLDTGLAFIVGRDYYVYLCDTGTLTDFGRVVISLNSTFPQGWNAVNSRKLGGFHFGVNRRTNARLQPVNAAGLALGANWEANTFNGIVPRSVWTLTHRPMCSPEGMVYLAAGVWVDIYLSSDNGAGGFLSRHNATPITGTEGLSCYGFMERMMVSGKRLLSYNEFIQAAFGSPQGLAGDNANAWTAASARQLTGFVVRAVSAIGCRDCVGNVWEWLNDLATRYDVSGAGAIGGFAWHDILGAGNGQAHQNANRQIISLIAGGHWNDAAHAGARALSANHAPWDVSAGIGGRGACDSL